MYFPREQFRKSKLTCLFIDVIKTIHTDKWGSLFRPQNTGRFRDYFLSFSDEFWRKHSSSFSAAFSNFKIRRFIITFVTHFSFAFQTFFVCFFSCVILSPFYTLRGHFLKSQCTLLQEQRLKTNFKNKTFWKHSWVLASAGFLSEFLHALQTVHRWPENRFEHQLVSGNLALMLR